MDWSATTLVLVALALALLLPVASCGKKSASGESPDTSVETSVAAEAEATGVDEELPPEVTQVVELDVESIIGSKCLFAEATLQDAGEGLEAAAIVQLADGEKADESGVLAVLAELADAYPSTVQVRLELWTPGEPDARFAQYVWNRELERLERFEASVPAAEYALYVPVREEESDASPQGFEAGCTGYIDGAGLADLKSFSASSPSWNSDTP